MIRDAILKLQELFEAQSKPVRFDGRLADRQYVLGGVVQDLPPPLENREFFSLDALIGYADELPGCVGEAVSPRPQALYSRFGVMLLPRPDDSRLQSRLVFSYSRPWVLLSAFAVEPRPLEQRAFVRMLEFDFRLEKALILPWRRLDFATAGLISGEVKRGGDRMGREISAQVTGESDLPETIPITLPIYETAGERATYCVPCQVDVDASAQRLALRPDPLVLATILESHLRTVAERLSAVDGLDVYFGQVLA